MNNLAYDFGSRVLSFDFQGKSVNLELHGNKVVVKGESGIGKTYLYNAIQLLKQNEMVNHVCLSKSFSNVFCYNRSTDSLLSHLRQHSQSLIIVDNGELVITDEVSEYVDNDYQNHYLIFGRGLCNLRLTPNNFAELCESDNCFSLFYKFNVVGL